MLQDIAYCVRGDLGSRVRMGEQRGDTGLALASLQHQHQQQQPLTTQSNHQHQNKRPGSDAVNSSSNNNSSSGGVRGAAPGSYGGKIMDTPDEFPAGMKVLVVDDDPVCLLVLEQLLRKCSYRGSLFLLSFQVYWRMSCVAVMIIVFPSSHPGRGGERHQLDTLGSLCPRFSPLISLKWRVIFILMMVLGELAYCGYLHVSSLPSRFIPLPPFFTFSTEAGTYVEPCNRRSNSLVAYF